MRAVGHAGHRDQQRHAGHAPQHTAREAVPRALCDAQFLLDDRVLHTSSDKPDGLSNYRHLTSYDLAANRGHTDIWLVPVAGDLFDFLYEVNMHNMRLLETHRDRTRPPRSGGAIAFVLAALAIALHLSDRTRRAPFRASPPAGSKCCLDGGSWSVRGRG